MLENYEGTALDTSLFEEEVQPTEEPEQTEEVAETVDSYAEESATEEVITDTPSGPVKYNIPGIGEVTEDEIKEWRNSGLRQGDYTRKTQELARQRAENKDAIELYQYLRNNPHIVQALKSADQNPNSVMQTSAPTVENDMLRQVMYNQKVIETDMKLAALKQKYGEVDEIALFNKAAELRTDDLESVYKIINYDNTRIDEAALIAKAKAELRAELESAKGSVGTIVDTRQTQPMEQQVTLTADQKRVAAAMGMSEKEYIKWMNN